MARARSHASAWAPTDRDTELRQSLANVQDHFYRTKTVAQDMIDELLLGPETLHLDKIAPRGTKLKSLILRRGILYADFSDTIFLGEKVSELSFDEILQTMRKTILFNFKGIKSIIITIEGQIPRSLKMPS